MGKYLHVALEATRVIEPAGELPVHCIKKLRLEFDKNPRLFSLPEEIHDGDPKGLHCMKSCDLPNMVKSVIHQINLNHFSHARPCLL